MVPPDPTAISVNVTGLGPNEAVVADRAFDGSQAAPISAEAAMARAAIRGRGKCRDIGTILVAPSGASVGILEDRFAADRKRSAAHESDWPPRAGRPVPRAWRDPGLSPRAMALGTQRSRSAAAARSLRTRGAGCCRRSG